MTILITGGTGNTGLALAQRLRAANHSVLLTTRSKPVPEPFQGVHFDWLDVSTHENPFRADANIDRMYIVPPHVEDTLATMKPFFELALAKGVKRIVLITSTHTGTPTGSPAMGKVQEYIVGLGVDYCVLRPTCIRDEDVIRSVAKDGLIPFVSVDDIADAAFSALVDEKSHNTDHILVGPELLTYDDAAAVFSEVLGRQITHEKLTDEEYLAMHNANGLYVAIARYLLQIEKVAAAGGEESFFYEEAKVIGKRRLVDYVKENRQLWIPK